MGPRIELSREESEEKPQGGLAQESCQSNAARSRLPFLLPTLPLPAFSSQAGPFRLTHWLGAFGDGEGGAQLVSCWRREFERGARLLELSCGPAAAARPAAGSRWLPPTCGGLSPGAPSRGAARGKGKALSVVCKSEWDG